LSDQCPPRAAVTAALRWLKTCGLIWELAKSTNKGSASLYGVYPRPRQFVQLCETANRPPVLQAPPGNPPAPQAPLNRWNASNGRHLQADADRVERHAPATGGIGEMVYALNRGSQYYGCENEPW
jgi:hypothetical protein